MPRKRNDDDDYLGPAALSDRAQRAKERNAGAGKARENLGDAPSGQVGGQHQRQQDAGHVRRQDHADAPAGQVAGQVRRSRSKLVRREDLENAEQVQVAKAGPEAKDPFIDTQASPPEPPADAPATHLSTPQQPTMRPGLRTHPDTQKADLSNQTGQEHDLNRARWPRPVGSREHNRTENVPAREGDFHRVPRQTITPREQTQDYGPVPPQSDGLPLRDGERQAVGEPEPTPGEHAPRIQVSEAPGGHG